MFKFKFNRKHTTQEFDSTIEPERLLSWQEIIINNLSLDKGLLPNLAFYLLIIIFLSLNVHLRNKISQVEVQCSLIKKDIEELKIENDASIYKIENINKVDNIIYELKKRKIAISRSSTPYRILILTNED